MTAEQATKMLRKLMAGKRMERTDYQPSDNTDCGTKYHTIEGKVRKRGTSTACRYRIDKLPWHDTAGPTRAFDVYTKKESYWWFCEACVRRAGKLW